MCVHRTWLHGLAKFACLLLFPSLTKPYTTAMHVSLAGVQVTISTEGQSTAGKEYTLVCSVSLAGGESVDDLTVEWLAPNGSVVESGSGTTQLTHTLNPLLPSHGGEYRCRATLQGDLQEDTVDVIVSGLSGRDCVEQTNGIHALHCSSTS